ncbi:MAG TPA: hypothetical protein VMP13_06140 [Acidimicrobiia bacterium]|nr:hypothetical protein [Acidimicrobiia bacterium]
MTDVTAIVTPLGAIQATGVPGGAVVEVTAPVVVVVADGAGVVTAACGADVDVGVGRTANPLQAVARRITAANPGSRLIRVSTLARLLV